MSICCKVRYNSSFIWLSAVILAVGVGVLPSKIEQYTTVTIIHSIEVLS